MAELIVISWLWGNKYDPRDVMRLANAVRKNLRMDHRFCLFADRPYGNLSPDIDVREIRDLHLTDRSCFCRLRMFDPAWQKQNGFTSQILALDLDLIITGDIGSYVLTNKPFMILKNVNAANPNPLNASVMMLRTGCHADVWTDFSVEKARAVPFHSFPDDQGWIWHKLPNADGWKAGAESGIYGFQKPGWPMGQRSTALPDDARIVAFIGRRKPWMFGKVPWVKKHWLNAA